MNFGLAINFCIVSAYTYGFWALLCLRLDRKIGLSYFVILIPLWLAVLYLASYFVVLGIASPNPRANKFEKIFLSLLVPSGFLATMILLVCYVEKLIKPKAFGYLFMPIVAGYLLLYLFIRCLVKPVDNRVEPIKN